MYCSICEYDFSVQRHVPICLPCGHSICADCLSQDDTLNCPNCDTPLLNWKLGLNPNIFPINHSLLAAIKQQLQLKKRKKTTADLPEIVPQVAPDLTFLESDHNERNYTQQSQSHQEHVCTKCKSEMHGLEQTQAATFPETADEASDATIHPNASFQVLEFDASANQPLQKTPKTKPRLADLKRIVLIDGSWSLAVFIFWIVYAIKSETWYFIFLGMIYLVLLVFVGLVHSTIRSNDLKAMLSRFEWYRMIRLGVMYLLFFISGYFGFYHLIRIISSNGYPVQQGALGFSELTLFGVFLISPAAIIWKTDTKLKHSITSIEIHLYELANPNQ